MFLRPCYRRKNGKRHAYWALMALVLVLCRLCNPSSELHIAEHSYAQSGLADLLGVPAEKINEQRLYRALDALLPHKEALQVYLKGRLGELFQLEYDLLLYDVTSTYFEGQAEANPLIPAPPTNGRFVVKTFPNRPLRHKDLRHLLANLGEPA